jgi:hypothetical protein
MNTLRSGIVMIALLAAGCGGGSAQDDVRSAWEEASHAAAGGDASHFCSLVTAEGKRTIVTRAKLSCEDGVRLLSSQLSSSDKAAIRGAKITQVEVHGDDATVTYAVSPALTKVGFTGVTRLQKVDGRWLLRGI